MLTFLFPAKTIRLRMQLLLKSRPGSDPEPSLERFDHIFWLIKIWWKSARILYMFRWCEKHTDKGDEVLFFEWHQLRNIITYKPPWRSACHLSTFQATLGTPYSFLLHAHSIDDQTLLAITRLLTIMWWCFMPKWLCTTNLCNYV